MKNIEKYVDKVFNLLDAPIKTERHKTDEEHKEIEDNYMRDWKQPVKSYYDTNRGINIIKFL